MNNNIKPDPNEVLRDKKATIHNNLSTAPAILSSAQLAAGGAAVSGVIEPIGGLLNYTVSYLAQRQIRKVTMPITDDMALMKLDKAALGILQARLQWLRNYAPMIERWRVEREDPKKMFNAVQTLHGVKQTTVGVYDRLVTEDKDVEATSLPLVIADMTAMLAGGGKRKLSDEAKRHLRGSINSSSQLLRFWNNNVEEIEKWEASPDNDEEWQCYTECMEIRQMKDAAGCQCGGDRLSRCECVIEGWKREGKIVPPAPPAP
jgi:hypothetical protein